MVENKIKAYTDIWCYKFVQFRWPILLKINMDAKATAFTELVYNLAKIVFRYWRFGWCCTSCRKSTREF